VYLEIGKKTSKWINTTIWNFKGLGRKKEDIQEFADRCKGLTQKIICTVDDPKALRIHSENAECKL